MLRKQAEVLTELGDELLAKARLCSKAADVQLFTELGLGAFREAREIWDSIRSNSVLTYFECRMKLGEELDYADYLDFCARNKLDSVSSTDFNSVGTELVNKILNKG